MRRKPIGGTQLGFTHALESSKLPDANQHPGRLSVGALPCADAIGKVSLNCNAAFEAVKTNHLGNNDKRKVYLKGITKQVTDRSLKTHFTKFGKLIKIYAIRDAADLETKNFGFIECQSPQTAVKILKKETHVVSGVEIQALPFESQKKSQKNVKPLS